MCIATTKKGKPCKNAPKEGEQMCGPHLDQAYASLMEAHEADARTRDEQQPIAGEPLHKEEESNMSENKLLLSGTGSRQLQIASPETKTVARDYLVRQITALKEKYGAGLDIMSGMAEGFDALLAKTAIDLEIPLILAIPNRGYGKYYWQGHSLTGRDRFDVFQWYVSQAACVVHVMEDVHNTNSLYLFRDGKKIHSNFVRNEYMVEHANAFYVYNGTSSGTAHCLGLIKAAGKPYKEVPMN